MLAQTALRLLDVGSIAKLSLRASTLGSPCNTFRGACLSDGEVFLGPDISQESYTGFSMWHNFTGDDGPFGAISQMPMIGNIQDPFKDIQDIVAGPELFGNGDYKAVTGSNITVELGASQHSGIYQYTFPENITVNVIIDVSHVSHPPQGYALVYKAGSLDVLPNGTYKGTGHYIDRYENVHSINFCGYFDDVANATLFELDGQNSNRVEPEKDGRSRHALTNRRVAAVLNFINTTVVSRVGISMDTVEEACKNVNLEIPKGVQVSDIGRNITSGSVDHDDDDPQTSAHHFKILSILLGVMLGLLFLCLIILVIVCAGAHKHLKTDRKQNKIDDYFRHGGTRERDGAADMPPTL